MPGDLENALRTVAERIAGYVENAARMTVETRSLRIAATTDGDPEQPRLLARTVLSLDGDSEVVIPMREAEDGSFRVDAEALDVHRANVRTAIEYRARMLDALLLVLQGRTRGDGS
jgi:hypothetical protein